MSGLCESVRHKWSGDIDLNDGKLEKHISLDSTLSLILGLGCRTDRDILF